MNHVFIPGKFRVLKEIGSGAFGKIYSGYNVQTGEPVAIKLEKTGVEYPQLRYEARIYATLQNHMRVPRMHYFGIEQQYSVMVMDQLGESMEDRKTRRGDFSLNEVHQVAVQTLDLLKALHSFGFIHRDIKPDNLLNERNTESIQLYLIDFGLSKRILDPITGDHVKPRIKKALTGTPRYASYANHAGKEQSRRDDLESLGYVLLYLFRGYLPWQNEVNFGTIMSAKHQNSRASLLQDSPQSFIQFFNRIDSLGFYDDPPYEALKKIF